MNFNIIEPMIGPIIGHTTNRSAKIWIQGESLKANYISFGVILIQNHKKPNIFIFPINNFDNIGIFNLGSNKCMIDLSKSLLEPNTRYIVKTGIIYIKDKKLIFNSLQCKKYLKSLKNNNDLIKKILSLPKSESEAHFRTFSDNDNLNNKKLSFIFGSCRYPGLFMQKNDSDQIFQHIFKHTSEINFFLMVGDQIYADIIGRFLPKADTYDEFKKCYQNAFSTPNLRQLMQHIPTYMILDDHEIEDNWSSDRLQNSPAKRNLFNAAIATYMRYQWVHSPQNYGQRLFYNFICNGYNFFALDVVTQSKKTCNESTQKSTPIQLIYNLFHKMFSINQSNCQDQNHLLGRSHEKYSNQLNILLKWLRNQQIKHNNRPKFLISSKVFAPNAMSERSGLNHFSHQTYSWAAYPETKKQILTCIIKYNIQNIIWLSGDIHCANISEFFFNSNNKIINKNLQKLKMFSIVSSPFFWPWSFSNGDPADFVHDSRKIEQKDSFKINKNIRLNYQTWNFYQKNNFTKVTLNAEKFQIKIEVFDQNGRKIKFSKEGILDLHPWK